MLVNYVRAHFTERIFTDIVSTLTLIWFDVNTYSLKHRWDHIGCQYFFANTNIAPYCVLWKSTVVQVILQVHRYSLYPTLLFCTMYWHPCYISFSMDLLKKKQQQGLMKKTTCELQTTNFQRVREALYCLERQLCFYTATCCTTLSIVHNHTVTVRNNQVHAGIYLKRKKKKKRKVRQQWSEEDRGSRYVFVHRQTATSQKDER